MALYKVEKYLFLLKNDPAMQADLRADPAAHLARQDLGDAERAALLKKDVTRLWEMGVHPLLLAPFVRFADLPHPEYRAAMSKLVGTRRIQS